MEESTLVQATRYATAKTVLPEYSLAGKTAIVTGGGRGIGKAIALTLAEAGAEVVVAARTALEVEQSAAEVSELGVRALAVPTDITRAEQVETLVDRVIGTFGKVDILVNNAGGVGGVKPMVPLPHLQASRESGLDNVDQMMSEEEWWCNLDATLRGTFLCVRAVGPHMISQRRGKIINITSMHAARGFEYNAGYCVSKAALARFTQTLAREWARYNINVNAIGPGLIKTEMTERYIFDREEVLQRNLSHNLLQRAGNPREIGLLAVYLASEAADWMTGQNIYLDGGYTCP